MILWKKHIHSKNFLIHKMNSLKSNKYRKQKRGKCLVFSFAPDKNWANLGLTFFSAFSKGRPDLSKYVFNTWCFIALPHFCKSYC